VLLAGESGSGKTHVLRALAADMTSPSLLSSGASFAEIFMGIAAARGARPRRRLKPRPGAQRQHVS